MEIGESVSGTATSIRVFQSGPKDFPRNLLLLSRTTPAYSDYSIDDTFHITRVYNTHIMHRLPKFKTIKYRMITRTLIGYFSSSWGNGR